MAWNPFGVAFEISASSGGVTRISATQYTVKINASWETYYSGAQTNYGMKASSGGGSVNLNTFGNKASSGSGSFTGTYSISGNGSATKAVTVTFTNYNTDNDDLATTTVSFNVTVPAWTSYTVKYDANGGSGAPSSQTKWKGQTLTLSSTKPTRTGYTFSKWNTKSDGSGTSYNSGADYTANSGVTLYAIWTEHALTVNYYSNNADYATYKGEEISGVKEGANVLVHSQPFYYDNVVSSGLADIQNSEYVYISRTGYTSTGYWGTSTTGGTLINQSTTYTTGQALAQAFGKSLASGNASVNVYPQWQINTYTIGYDGNGGYGSMEVQSVDWQETFTLFDNQFKREGYKFVGWNAQREIDRKWYVNGQGWLTEDEITANGYEKKLYLNQDELIFDLSWIKGETGVIHQYTMYAIWEISGVVYIDNGTTFEPYLAYIDNGTDWELYLMYVDDGIDWNIIS